MEREGLGDAVLKRTKSEGGAADMKGKSPLAMSLYPKY